MTVWKYDVPVDDYVTLTMPEGARILTVGSQDPSGRTIQLWAEVEPEAKWQRYFFNVVGTGHPIPPTCEYVGTAFAEPFVWHLYRRAGE